MPSHDEQNVVASRNMYCFNYFYDVLAFLAYDAILRYWRRQSAHLTASLEGCIYQLHVRLVVVSSLGNTLTTKAVNWFLDCEIPFAGWLGMSLGACSITTHAMRDEIEKNVNNAAGSVVIRTTELARLRS